MTFCFGLFLCFCCLINNLDSINIFHKKINDNIIVNTLPSHKLISIKYNNVTHYYNNIISKYNIIHTFLIKNYLYIILSGIIVYIF